MPDIERLLEIEEEIRELVEEARDIVRGTGEEARAESYWIPHILCALSQDHGYLGGSLITMHETTKALGEIDE